jgi:L-fucose dehydrogenase
MDLGLKDKVVIVTGGAKGIGEAITKTFAAEGAITVIFGRNEEEAAAIIEEASAKKQRVDSLHVEMTEEPQIKSAIDAVLKKYGRIDVIINNAGVNDGMGLRKTPAEFVQSLQKNLVHYFTLVHYSLDALIATKGTIVNITSKVADTGQGGTSGYAASKGGINALTREWAVDLAKHSIRVNAVVPAEVLTPLYTKWLNRTAKDPKAALDHINKSIPFEHRTTTSQEIADMVVFLASNKSSHTTGQIIYVDGGYVHLDRAYTSPNHHLSPQ